MYTFILLCFCWCLSLADEPNSSRIIGGNDASINDFPYQVSIQSGTNHICGGTIIHERTIATAAHCVVGKKPSSLSIRAGSNSSVVGGTVIQARAYRIHELYQGSNFNYDLALIYLSQNLTYGEGIQAISLSQARLCGNTDVEISGWGTLSEGGTVSRILQSVQFTIISPRTCRQVYGAEFGDAMFCAGTMFGGKDSCQGDSGGPLTMGGELIGITSHGRGCGRVGYPGVYIRVPLVRGWIIQHMTS